uniref:Uncharacterized protein n=1 Tax=Arundo donax TaxID=35708 RepID=A0A0A9BZ22_ARUDO
MKYFDVCGRFCIQRSSILVLIIPQNIKKTCKLISRTKFQNIRAPE